MEISYFDRASETANREAIAGRQLARLRTLLKELLASNSFYGRRLRGAGFTDARQLHCLEDFSSLPFTRKGELVEDQEAHPPFGTNLTFPLDRYIHLHQTSGTTGKPLRWLDTPESWDWWARCWAAVYCAAGVTPADRIFFAFSFGPFIGFWAAWAGCRKIGALAISGGAQDSRQRLKNLVQLQATVLCCTPSYALHLAEVARRENIEPERSAVEKIIVAGEPGGSVPGTKARIEEAWGARVYDHTGATEIGAHGMTCLGQCGVHLNEGEFLVEVIDPRAMKPSDEGELVITNLDRIGSPVLRYRTGDHVRINRDACGCGRTYARMEGGIIGRVDQMLIVRGVNIFPSSLESIVRSFPRVEEFRVIVDEIDAMDALRIVVEVAGENPGDVAGALEREAAHRLGLRIGVELSAEPLPRFEMKAARVVDRRAGAAQPHFIKGA
ncbi:MAG: phenylacetate--CoA ligase family protein [Acidobacteria bacterium]|nr:phenylacetate--CoA ligase family protein [Acidobacteriota bacterium]